MSDYPHDHRWLFGTICLIVSPFENVHSMVSTWWCLFNFLWVSTFQPHSTGAIWKGDLIHVMRRWCITSLFFLRFLLTDAFLDFRWPKFRETSWRSIRDAEKSNMKCFHRKKPFKCTLPISDNLWNPFRLFQAILDFFFDFFFDFLNPSSCLNRSLSIKCSW